MTVPALDPPLVALFDASRGQVPAAPIEDHATWLIPITATNRLVQDLHKAACRRIFAGTLVPG